jgi:hypothetical protein
MDIMLNKGETRSLTDGWLASNNDDIPFNIEKFKNTNNLNEIEGNYITEYFRSMCRKFRETQHNAEDVADEIKKLDKIGKTKESEIMRQNYESRLEFIFGRDPDMALKWFQAREDEKFEILKELLKKSGIYYRIRSSTNGKEYISPTFDQKYDKQWTTVFGRIRTAIKTAQDNCEIFINQMPGRTLEECRSSLKVVQVIYDDLKVTTSIVERKKDMITNVILTLSGGGGGLLPTGQKEIQNEDVYISDIRKSFKSR